MGQLDEVIRSLRWDCGGSNGQGDPDDHLRWMFNRMEEEMSPEAYKVLTSFSTLLLSSSMACDLCGSVSQKKDCEEGLLSIPLQPNPKADKRGFYQLDRYLEEHFSGDIISDHRCENCNEKSDKSRSWRITHAPDALTIQFKRFDWEGQKDYTKVGYPSLLDLTPYLASDSSTAKYQLNGVITHYGRSTGAGHYRCIAKQPNSGEWSLLDDVKVRESTVARACEPGTHYKGDYPYILSYMRVMEEGA